MELQSISSLAQYIMQAMKSIDTLDVFLKGEITDL